jgi:hypothetical protein
MATKTGNTDAYNKIESLVMERLLVLEAENAQLKQELAMAQAKLEIYERIATVSDSKITLGFGPPISKEGGN